MQRADEFFNFSHLFQEMRQLWADPLSLQRALDDVRKVRQGNQRAHVYAALLQDKVARCGANIFSQAMLIDQFERGLDSRAAAHLRIKRRDFDREMLMHGTPGTLPSLAYVVSWASDLDDEITKSGPSSTSHPRSTAISSTSNSRSSSANTNTLDRPPPSPEEKQRRRLDWTAKAERWQKEHLVVDRATWGAPPAHDAPSGVRCWNCGGVGHWSVLCRLPRVEPRKVTFARVSSLPLIPEASLIDLDSEAGKA
jgi:hypothetical protein